MLCHDIKTAGQTHEYKYVCMYACMCETCPFVDGLEGSEKGMHTLANPAAARIYEMRDRCTHPLTTKLRQRDQRRTNTDALIGLDSDIALRHEPVAEQAMQVQEIVRTRLPKT